MNIVKLKYLLHAVGFVKLFIYHEKMGDLVCFFTKILKIQALNVIEKKKMYNFQKLGLP